MIRHIRVLAAAAVTLAGACLQAQGQACQGAAAARDACRKAIDLVNFVSPQYAAALAGGNPTIAQSGTLGGLGHVAVVVRSTHVSGSLPKIGDVGFTTGGETKARYVSASTLIPALSVDVAFGLFRGFAAGSAHVLGVDGLLSATYMSALGTGSVDVELEGSNTNFGFGGRLGILEETDALPGVALTYLKRDMPRFAVTGITTVGNGTTTAPGTITGSSLLVTTSSYRLTTGKRFGRVDVSGGAGQDKYESSANVRGIVSTTTPASTQSATGVALLEMTRTNLFVGGALNVAFFKFVGEIGMATGGTSPTATNEFGSNSADARTYFTLAIRIGF